MPSHYEGDSQEVLIGGLAGDKFKWCVSFLQKRGREQFGEKFEIMESDHNLIFKLLVYFIGDKHHATELNIDLSKGILLSGPIGCGKTSLIDYSGKSDPPFRKRFDPPL